MGNNHVITREIGNLRGFSTDNIFVRPANVAETALNIQAGPDESLQLRRGYQCQIANTGGMGIGTVDDPDAGVINTVVVGADGFLYKKLTKQIYFEYDGRIMGDITNVTNPSADLTQVTSVAHGLQTGAQIYISGVVGAIELNTPFASFGINFYTITVVDANNFILDGIAFSLLSAYISGGTWSIVFANGRYLTLRIFTDPRFLNAISNQSITANFIANRAAQIDGNQNNVNTIVVQYGASLSTNDIVQFYDINGIFIQRIVLASTLTSVTIDGAPVSVLDGVFINQFIEFIFGKGFDVTAPYLISTFITTATSPSNGVDGLQIAINGDTNLPAAFFQILEDTLIPSDTIYIMDYWYWLRINTTINPPFPGSANPIFQNSKDFENASMAVYDDVIYIANGWDYPQKYDGQTVYRTGMPIGVRPIVTDNTTFLSLPFTPGDKYEYAITYEQVDAKGHILEGELSDIFQFTVGVSPAAADVTVNNLTSLPGANWNTDFALAVGGAATTYGPDIDGFFYDLVDVSPAFTIKIGDSAYYGDVTGAVITGANTDFTIPVTAGHAIVPGDTVYFFDASNNELHREVFSVTATTVTVRGDPFTVPNGTDTNMLVYKTSLVFGNVAIVDGNQIDTNVITVKDSYPGANGHTIQPNDVVEFIDSQGNLQRRNVGVVTATTIAIDQTPVNVSDLILIASTNQRTDAITLRRLNENPATLSDGTAGNISNAISNNLRINIYRTNANESFGTNGELFLVASIPNDGSGTATQVYIDGIPDVELGVAFDDPDQAPNPPPISKYLKCFGTQMFYAGGERGKAENSDRVFFSGVSGLIPNPEVVPLSTNLFNVPNLDDDITGIGVSGTTIVTTKNKSLWAATGNFLSGQIEVVQIAPGTNIGCAAHASIASVGTLMYFLHTNGVYAITENQLFPTDPFGNPIPISLAIDLLFRQTNYLPWTKYVLKRAVAINYTKDNQYLLFLPCEDSQATIRTANANCILLAYDYEGKNWFKWDNINAAGGMIVIDDDLYFQERRFSGVDGNTANLYKQHRFYRLIDHADHAGPQRAEWLSSWEDLGQPEVRKKFCRCVLLMDRLSELFQYNNPRMTFSSYLNRLPDLQNTIADITQTDNIRNAGWGISPWGWGYWSGYQDSFVTVNLRQGTVAKSIQVGFKIEGINMDIRFAGFQLEAIPENRKSVVR